MVPLYLPLTLDEPDESAQTPIFYSGINVYLEQKSSWFQNAPNWLRRLFASRGLLRLASGKAGSTRPAELGEMTLSMLRGQDGRQAREMEELTSWLKTQPTSDVVCLSNALLLGMGPGLKAALGAPLLCYLQGEDWFLDALPEPHRTEAWKHLRQISRFVDRFVAPSRYFGDLMTTRLELDPQRVSVIPNGIRLEGYPQPTTAEINASSLPATSPLTQAAVTQNAAPPVIGFFARQCPEKGLDILVEAFIQLNRRGRIPGCRLKIGGSCGPSDEGFVAAQKDRLRTAGLLGQVTFHPNLERTAKIDFLRSLSIFSVPARYGEAFGLYVIEALAAGVPVIEPRTAAFTELIEQSNAGRLFPPDDASALAQELEAVLLDRTTWATLRQHAFRATQELFNARVMAARTVEVFEKIIVSQSSKRPAVAPRAV